MITSITSTLIREGCSITSITSYIFGSNGSITSSLLQIVLHYYTITSITSSSLLHKHFHYFPLVGKVMGSNGSITSYYVPPQLGDAVGLVSSVVTRCPGPAGGLTRQLTKPEGRAAYFRSPLLLG